MICSFQKDTRKWTPASDSGCASMGIHSVFLVSKSTESLLYARYFDSDELLSCTSKGGFEGYLLSHTRRYWPNLEAPEVDRFSVCLDGTLVVLVLIVGDLMLYVNGTDEMDEASLPEPAEALRDVVIELVGVIHGMRDTEKINEGYIVENSDLYAKLAMSVDEMFPLGVIEQLEVKTVMRLIKLKE